MRDTLKIPYATCLVNYSRIFKKNPEQKYYIATVSQAMKRFSIQSALEKPLKT